MEWSTRCETDSFSASQEIPLILWNANVNYHGHKIPPSVSTPIQISAVHANLTSFLQMNFNSIYSYIFWAVSFPQVSPPKPCNYLSTIRATCPAHLVLFGLITQIKFGEQYRSSSSSLCSFLHSPVTSSLLGPNIFLSTLFANTFRLSPCLYERDQVSNPYNTADKITVMYILIFTFHTENWKTKDPAPNISRQVLNSV